MDNCPAKNPEAIENLFPDWITPEDRTRAWRCPDISWQSSPLILTDILTKILKEYFSDPSNFPENELRELLKSRLPIITQFQSADGKTAGQKPRIGIDFVTSQMDERSFGQYNQTGYNIHNSTGDFFTLWKIQHKVEIVANAKRECLVLGEAVCRLFNHYRTVILGILKAADFKVVQFQGASLVSEEDPSLGYQASLGLLTTAYDTWCLTEVAPRLKRINYKIQED